MRQGTRQQTSKRAKERRSEGAKRCTRLFCPFTSSIDDINYLSRVIMEVLKRPLPLQPFNRRFDLWLESCVSRDVMRRDGYIQIYLFGKRAMGPRPYAFAAPKPPHKFQLEKCFIAFSFCMYF